MENTITQSPYQISQLADTVSAFGRDWGTGYLERLVIDGQITRADADCVLLHVTFPPAMPTTYWKKSAVLGQLLYTREA